MHARTGNPSTPGAPGGATRVLLAGTEIAIVSIGEDVEKNAVYPTRPDTGDPTPQRGVASSNV